MSITKSRIEPWTVYGGYRLAHVWWEYVCNDVEGWDQEHSFAGLPEVTWLTEEAALQAMEGLQ